MKNVRKDSPRTDSVWGRQVWYLLHRLTNKRGKMTWLKSFDYFPSKKKKFPNKVILQTFYPVTTQLQSKNFLFL